MFLAAALSIMPAAVIQSGRRIGSNPGTVRRKLHPLAFGRESVSGCPEQLRKAESEAEEKGSNLE